MTRKELSQLHDLNKEVEREKERLSELDSKAHSPSEPNLSGMPGGGTGSKTERDTERIDCLKKIISAKIELCECERIKLEKYIAKIPDSQTRQMFELQFINGLSCLQTALSIGGGNTAEGVRKRTERFIKLSNLTEAVNMARNEPSSEQARAFLKLGVTIDNKRYAKILKEVKVSLKELPDKSKRFTLSMCIFGESV